MGHLFLIMWTIHIQCANACSAACGCIGCTPWGGAGGGLVMPQTHNPLTPTITSNTKNSYQHECIIMVLCSQKKVVEMLIVS